MRHAVNVSESGSIPEAAAISCLYTWGEPRLSIVEVSGSNPDGGAKQTLVQAPVRRDRYDGYV